MAAWSLRAYSFGLIAFMLIKVLAPGYYARQDIATPVAIGIKAMVANMILNFLFVLPLMYFWNMGHVGLALATSVSAWMNAGLLLRGLLREGVYHFQGGWGAYLLRLLAATAAMAGVVLFIVSDSASWLAWTWDVRAGQMALVCGAGVVAYFLVHLVTGSRLQHLRAPSARL